MTKPIINLEHIDITFYQKKREIEAVKDVSITIDKGTIYGIVGYSGAGKSTLVRTINLLQAPTSGKITIGDDVTFDNGKVQLKGAALRQKRQKIGMIFQHFNLMAQKTARQNVAFALRHSKLSKEEKDKKVADLLELVDLSDRAENYPAQLSGGQKQRVAIARALANDPEILISDESTSALDPKTTKQILALLKDLNQKLGLTVVMITHEMQIVKDICNRVAVMQNGQLLEEGSVLDIFSNPQEDLTQEFIETAAGIEDALAKIEELSALAPLHNPGAASGIRAFKELLPDITSVAVFDTAFHTSMPEVAYRYPVPNRYYTDYQVRKYGAHGTSHQYVSQEAAKLLGKPIEETKIITAHVGNGVSITAVDGGKSVDTSMGLTPLGGVMMGTRTGDLDPAIIPFIIDREPDMADAERIRHVFNKESGLLGISEKSSDMRDIIAGKEAGDEKCALAYNLYVDRLRKYIAQYFGVLNGADAIVFTAGIGENSADVRASVLDGLTWFGIEVDPEKNVFGHVGDITTAESAVKVFVIPTDEELVIARDVERLKTK